MLGGENMNGTIALHFDKHTSTKMNGLQIHFERIDDSHKHSNVNIDSSKSHNNLILETSMYKGAESKFTERYETILEKHYTAKRKIRSNAVTMISGTIQFGGDFVKETDEAQQVELLKYLNESFKDKYFRKDCYLSAAIHVDETTPHLHFEVVPITKDGRLCAKDLVNKKTLREMQAAVLDSANEWAALTHNGVTFARADEVGRGFANGKSQKEFERLSKVRDDAKSERKQLIDARNKRIEGIDDSFRKIRDEKSALKRRENDLKVREDKVSKKEQETHSEALRVSQRASKVSEREKVVKARESDLRAREEDLKAREQETRTEALRASERLSEVKQREKDLEAKRKADEARKLELDAREKSVAERENRLEMMRQKLIRASKQLLLVGEPITRIQDAYIALQKPIVAFAKSNPNAAAVFTNFKRYIGLDKVENIEKTKQAQQDVQRIHDDLDMDL